MPIWNGQRPMSSGPRVLIMCPLWSSQTLRFESQTADGIPSLSLSSTCHCWQRVAGQRIRAGPSSEQAGEHGARRERESLADADLIGQEQADPAVGLAVVQEETDERPLPGLELFAPAVERALLPGRRLQRQRGSSSSKLDSMLAGAAADFLDDGVGEGTPRFQR